MDNLKKIITKKYIIITFAFMFIISAVDSIFDTLIFPNEKLNLSYFLTMYIVIHIILFYLVARLFYRSISLNINKEKEEKNKELNMLFSNISHDIKSPLTSINGYSKAILDGKIKGEDKIKETMEVIYSKGKTMNDLLNNLILYTKLNNLEVPMNFKKVEINAFLKTIIADNYLDFEEKKIELNIDISNEKFYCLSDEVELRRALENIISNMVKHNDIGAKAEISGKLEGDVYKILFKDNGKKLDIKEMDALKTAFYRKEEERSTEGHGLGLSISNFILEKHGFNLSLINYDNDIYTKAFEVEIKTIKN